MGTVTLRDTVSLAGLQPAGIRILATVDNCARELHLDLVVTCGTDSHGPDDPHTRGVALDVQSKLFSAPMILTLYRMLTEALGPMFTVLYEVPRLVADPQLAPIAYVNADATGPHFHVQLKRAVTWPSDRMMTA